MKNITQLNNIYTILNTLQNKGTVYMFDLFTNRTRSLHGKQLLSLNHYLQIEEYNDIYKTEEEPYTIKYSEVQELIDKYDLNPLFLTQFKKDFNSGRYLYFVIN